MPQLQSEPPAQSSAADSGSSSGAADALSHLAKMSATGSSFGQADYVAISTLAISSLVLGMLSLLSLVFTVFLTAGIVSVFIGLLAIFKISRSSGTQSGILLALAGMLVSFLVGGKVVADQVKEWSTTRQNTQKCSELISRFSDEVKAQHYDQAYQAMFTDKFHSKFDLNAFRTRLQEVFGERDAGGLDWLKLGDQPIKFEPMADTDARQGVTLAQLKVVKKPDIWRVTLFLNNAEGEWKIDSMPQFFREKKKKGADDQQ